jgi:hypothetical protein
MGYFDLSESGDIKEAMKNYYQFLRLAENIKGAKLLFIISLKDYAEQNSQEVGKLNEFLETVYDKTFRSASGKKMYLDSDFINLK